MYNSDELARGLQLAQDQVKAARTEQEAEYWQVVVITMADATMKANAIEKGLRKPDFPFNRVEPSYPFGRHTD